MGDWRSVPLHISRKRVQLEAPGLCSYVAASCGGALGRLCLAEKTAEAENFVENPVVSLEDLMEEWLCFDNLFRRKGSKDEMMLMTMHYITTNCSCFSTVWFLASLELCLILFMLWRSLHSRVSDGWPCQLVRKRSTSSAFAEGFGTHQLLRGEVQCHRSLDRRRCDIHNKIP